jgi:tetratricopeptide (TPR) repeat protein
MDSSTQIAKSNLSVRCLLALVALLSCPVAQAQMFALPGPNISDEADHLGIHDAKGDVKGKYQEGLVLLRAGECQKAQENFGLVLKQANGDANVQFLQGMAFRCLKLHDKAARQFRKAIRTNRDLHVAYKYLAFSYLDLEEPKKPGEILLRLDRLRKRCGGQCPDTLLAVQTDLAAEIKRRQPE